jgi:Neutral/alkaline non-lysosomal ceramidase, N-terminal
MRSLAWLGAVAVWSAVTAQEPPLQMGLAEIDITPPAGYRMDGYFTERLATGQKDPLKAKALVFQQGTTRAALVACDLLGMPQSMSREVRARAAERTGIPAANIAITATHTHTGPLFAGERARIFSEQAAARFGKDPLASVDYPETLGDKLVDVIVEANARLSPAAMELVRTEDDRLSFNRRYHLKDGSVRFNPGVLNPEIVRPAGPIDPDLPFIVFTRDNKPIGSLTVFALHADTVGGTEYSADYPGQLAAELRREFGEGFISVFGLGTCGDINHIDVSGRRKYDARLIGRQLGVDLLSARPRQPIERAALAVASTQLSLALRSVSTEQAAIAKANAPKIGSSALPFLAQVETATTLDLLRRGSTLDAEVQAFRLSPEVAIVLLPGEVFADLGLAIKRGSPFRHTLVVELANDNPAYIPTEKAFKEGSYETVNSRIAPGGGERLAEAAIQLLKDVARAPVGR